MHYVGAGLSEQVTDSRAGSDCPCRCPANGMENFQKVGVGRSSSADPSGMAPTGRVANRYLLAMPLANWKGVFLRRLVVNPLDCAVERQHINDKTRAGECEDSVPSYEGSLLSRHDVSPLMTEDSRDLSDQLMVLRLRPAGSGRSFGRSSLGRTIFSPTSKPWSSLRGWGLRGTGTRYKVLHKVRTCPSIGLAAVVLVESEYILASQVSIFNYMSRETFCGYDQL